VYGNTLLNRPSNSTNNIKEKGLILLNRKMIHVSGENNPTKVFAACNSVSRIECERGRKGFKNRLTTKLDRFAITCMLPTAGPSSGNISLHSVKIKTTFSVTNKIECRGIYNLSQTDTIQDNTPMNLFLR
jgi:hypothetical protein